MTNKELEALEGFINFDDDLDLKIGVSLSRAMKKINTPFRYFVNYNKYKSIFTLLTLSIDPKSIEEKAGISSSGASVYMYFKKTRKVKDLEIKGLLVEFHRPITGSQVFITVHADGKDCDNSLVLSRILAWSDIEMATELVETTIDMLVSCVKEKEELTYHII